MSAALVQYPTWLEIAFRELVLDVKEIPGSEHSARILEYFQATSLKPYNGDETAWCSAGQNWCLRVDGIVGTNLANARSFETWGVEVAPRIGALVPMWRVARDSWQGHIAMLLAWTPNRIQVIGANQGNQWSVKEYDRGRALKYRWPTVDMRFT